MPTATPTALTVAAFDSSGGAGVAADLKVFLAHWVRGVAVVTGVTAQSETELFHRAPVDNETLAAQFAAAERDAPISAWKTGAMVSADAVRLAIAFAGSHRAISLVVDPVLASTSGASLLEADAEKMLLGALLPLAELVTPNVPEAERILGRAIASAADMEDAARELLRLGPRMVLLKGGHLRSTGEVVDVIASADGVELLRNKRLDVAAMHGTGCALSAAITANLASGAPPREAVGRARAYLMGAMLRAKALPSGARALDLGWTIDE